MDPPSATSGGARLHLERTPGTTPDGSSRVRMSEGLRLERDRSTTGVCVPTTPRTGWTGHTRSFPGITTAPRRCTPRRSGSRTS